MTTTYYRIQPTGMSLFGHASEDWSGDLMDGRVCCYSSPEAVISGRDDDWSSAEASGCELVEFEADDFAWLPASSAGGTATPLRETGRRDLLTWLRDNDHEFDAEDYD